MGQFFQGDLNNKLIDCIKSKDFEGLDSNCYKASNVDGKCIFNGVFRKSTVVYKATCKFCGMF